jgi:hypothetical protein
VTISALKSTVHLTFWDNKEILTVYTKKGSSQSIERKSFYSGKVVFKAAETTGTDAGADADADADADAVGDKKDL